MFSPARVYEGLGGGEEQNCTATLFDSLKGRDHLLLQVAISFMSDCSLLTSSSQLTTLEHFVSSAKRCTVENMTESGKSLMKTRNNRGPSMLSPALQEFASRWPAQDDCEHHHQYSF